jgi:hypothetical protein
MRTGLCMREWKCAVIRIRYDDFSAGRHDGTGLHGRAERGERGVTVYLLPGLAAYQRRAVIRRLRQEASRGFGPSLPLPQLAVALGLDRVRTAAKVAGGIVRLHPAGTLVPGACVVVMMMLFVFASADGPGVISKTRGGLAEAASTGLGAAQAVAAGQARVQSPLAAQSPLVIESPLITKSPVVTQSPLVIESPLITKSPVVTKTPLARQTPLVTVAEGADVSRTGGTGLDSGQSALAKRHHHRKRHWNRTSGRSGAWYVCQPTAVPASRPHFSKPACCRARSRRVPYTAHFPGPRVLAR